LAARTITGNMKACCTGGARGRRSRRDRAREAYESGPTKLIIHLPDWKDPSGGGSEIDELVEKLKKTMRDGIDEAWRHVQATDRVMREVVEDFDGEDPAMSDVRHVLNHTTEKPQELHEDIQRYTGSYELPVPSEDDMVSMREIVERAL
jgi:hypothetical protein